MKRSSPVADSRVFGNPPATIRASVIIVAYKTGDELFACLDSLQAQTTTDFEIIVVDNDTCDMSRLATYSLTYLRLNTNYGPSLARNQGATIAKGDVLLFLDDDAVASPQWVQSALAALADRPELCAVRGRISPKHPTYANKLAYHYDLGTQAHPAFLDLEGNCAIRTQAYRAVRGFEHSLFGGEGLDISYRLETAGQGAIYYLPDMLIAHDYVDSWRHFLHKSYRHGRNETKLGTQDEAVVAYKQHYMPYYMPTTPPPLFERTILFALYLIGKAASLAGAWTAHYTRASSRKAPTA